MATLFHQCTVILTEGAWKRYNEHYAPSDPWPSHSWVIRKPAICYLYDLLMAGCYVTKVGGAVQWYLQAHCLQISGTGCSPALTFTTTLVIISSNLSCFAMVSHIHDNITANINLMLLLHITLLTKFKNNVLPAVMITRF